MTNEQLIILIGQHRSRLKTALAQMIEENGWIPAEIYNAFGFVSEEYVQTRPVEAVIDELAEQIDELRRGKE